MKPRERFLVVGADGLIGRSLMNRLSREGHEVLGTTRQPDNVSPEHPLLDLGGEIADWQPLGPFDAAFLCAAITSQEACRRDPTGSRKVNVSGSVAVAEKLVKAGTPVVFLSTSLVFDGARALPKPTEPTNPNTEYGRQKAAAEQALCSLGGTVAVLRLSKVIYPKMPLLSKWVAALRASQPIYPLTDLRCSPVSLDFAVAVIHKAGLAGVSGIFQLSGEREISYAEIAQHLAKKLNASQLLVCPRTSGELGLQLEHLPAHTALDCSTLESRLGLKVPDVLTTLDSVFADSISP